MSLWDTYTWLLVSAAVMRTITLCAIYGNLWGRQEGGRERFSATLQLVSCCKTTRRGSKETSGYRDDLGCINYLMTLAMLLSQKMRKKNISMSWIQKHISFPRCRSLELFFASSQNSKLLYGEPPSSPRASRKFSSPPPLAITKNSSPNRRRKLSLNIPIITGGKALDLAALSCSSNGYASMYSTMSPFSKTTLDINKLYVSSSISSKITDEGEDKKDKVEDPSVTKQGEWTGAITKVFQFWFQGIRLSLMISLWCRSLRTRRNWQWSQPEWWRGPGSLSHQIPNHAKKHQMQEPCRYIVS